MAACLPVSNGSKASSTQMASPPKKKSSKNCSNKPTQLIGKISYIYIYYNIYIYLIDYL